MQNSSSSFMKLYFSTFWQRLIPLTLDCGALLVYAQTCLLPPFRSLTEMILCHEVVTMTSTLDRTLPLLSLHPLFIW